MHLLVKAGHGGPERHSGATANGLTLPGFLFPNDGIYHRPGTHGDLEGRSDGREWNGGAVAVESRRRGCFVQVAITEKGKGQGAGTLHNRHTDTRGPHNGTHHDQ